MTTRRQQRRSEARSRNVPERLGKPCETCGKVRYRSRKDAKRAGRLLYPGNHMSAYPCGEFFHIGNAPRWLIHGKQTGPPATETQPQRPEEKEVDHMAMPVAELLDVAAQQGVQVKVRGGVLTVSGPSGSEPTARLLRDREADVLAVLKPEREIDVPQIGETATIRHRKEDLASDAQAVWKTLRELARAAGDESGTDPTGVLYRGARDQVIRNLCPEWTRPYMTEIGNYLADSGNVKCQSRHATPPIWWVRDTWNDGGLTVTKKPSPADMPKRVQSEEEQRLLVSDDQLLELITLRLCQDANATARIEELETANEALRSHIEDLTRELDQKNTRLAAFEAARAVFVNGAL